MGCNPYMKAKNNLEEREKVVLHDNNKRKRTLKMILKIQYFRLKKVCRLAQKR